jgi:hypothetical protein
VELRLPLPADAFAGEDVTTLLDSVFVVSEAREVLPGLARARALLESQHASLSADPSVVTFTLPASSNPNA